MRRHLQRILLGIGFGTVTVLTLAAAPAPAEAQWHGHTRFYVSFGGYWPYPYWGPYWGPRFGFGFGYPWGGPWGGPYPYGAYGPYPWPYYGWDPNSGSARLQGMPREARVFVDGYAAGVVDDFDGTFQRLRTRPGGHEVTVYLDGYRTVSQHVYFRPDSTQNIRFTMEKTAPGEVSEPPPAPQPPSRGREGGDPDRPAGERPSRGEQQGPPIEQPQVRYGTLTIAVQPVDAEIYLDGERWTGPTSTPGGIQRLTIRVTEGRHRVEIRKEGFATYSEQILIGRDRVLTLNVSLNK